VKYRVYNIEFHVDYLDKLIYNLRNLSRCYCSLFALVVKCKIDTNELHIL